MPTATPTRTQGDLPLQMRSAMLERIEQNEGAEFVYRVTWTTGANVRRYDRATDQFYDEELHVDAKSVRLERLNSGNAPVLDSHSAYSIDDVKGIVVAGTARINGGLGVADIQLDNGPENDAVVRKVRNGMIRNVSIGYRVYRYEVIQREGQVPLYRATDWEPFEISLVPIGADAGAGIRSGPVTYPCEFYHPLPKETRMPETENPQTPPTPTPATVPANDNPAPPTPPAPETPAAPAQEAARAEGARAERTRMHEINQITRAARLPESFAQRCINDNVSIDNTRKMALDELARQSGEGGEIRSHISIVRDEFDTTRSLVENALLHRHNPQAHKLEDGARQYRGLSLLEIGRDLLEARGIRTRGMARAELAGHMLGLDTRSGGLHGTTDFPFILANVANKTLRAAYEAAPQTFKPFCRQTTNPDFKMIARTQLGDAPNLDKVNEGGEFKRGSVGEAREQYALATYGKVVAITRQVIINDDLSAFTRLPEMFGRAAADLESDTVWSILTANAAMGDGNALFHASHGNLAGSGTAITVTSLGDARKAMRQQKGLNGRFINVLAKYLIVPTALETVAQQYMAQTNIVVTKASDFNPFANTLQVIAEPRLDAASAINWFTAADPGQIDTIEYAYLEGQEGVYLENRVGFDIDGVELKARLDFAAKAIDWRGFYKNPGA